MSLSEYRKNAIRIVKYLGFQVNEENIGEATTAVMMADHIYDETKGKRSTIRFNYVFYYLKDMIKRKNKKPKIRLLETDKLELFPKMEKLGKIKTLLEDVRESILSERQKRIIEMYYWDNMTMKEISLLESCSISTIEAEIKKSLRTLKYVV